MRMLENDDTLAMDRQSQKLSTANPLHCCARQSQKLSTASSLLYIKIGLHALGRIFLDIGDLHFCVFWPLGFEHLQTNSPMLL